MVFSSVLLGDMCVRLCVVLLIYMVDAKGPSCLDLGAMLLVLGSMLPRDI